MMMMMMMMMMMNILAVLAIILASAFVSVAVAGIHHRDGHRGRVVHVLLQLPGEDGVHLGLTFGFAVLLLGRASLCAVRERPVQRFAHKRAGASPASGRFPATSSRDRAPPSTSASTVASNFGWDVSSAEYASHAQCRHVLPLMSSALGSAPSSNSSRSPRHRRATHWCEGSRATFPVPRRSRPHAARPRRRRTRQPRARRRRRRTRSPGPARSFRGVVRHRSCSSE